MTEEEDDLDELLQPTVTPVERSGYKPWRVQSQFWVAFFGGIVAVTAVAFINSGHLGMSARSRGAILAAGAAALAVWVALAVWLVDENAQNLRIAGRILAVVLFLVLARMQRPADARYQLFGAGEYAALWGVGIPASIIGGLAQAGIAVLLSR